MATTATAPPAPTLRTMISRNPADPTNRLERGLPSRLTGRAILLLPIAILGAACGGEPGGEAPRQGSGGSPPPADVGFITVQPRDLSLSTELPGRVVAYRTAEIRPQVSGIVLERLFDEGSFVEAGEQLYQIDPARYEADCQVARANLQNAEARRDNARTLAERHELLVESRAVSVQEYDDAQARLIQAEAEVALAEAELRTAKIDLEYTRVNSPIDGYISPSAVTEGALVTARQERALATVRQLDPVYVDLSQSAQAKRLEENLMADRIGSADGSVFGVTLRLGNRGEAYPESGRLDATDFVVNEQTGSIRLRSVFPNPDLVLLPGLFVRATVTQPGTSEAILIPQKCVLIESGGRKAVWVIGPDSTARKREVRTGATHGNHWIVLSGLETGDRLIVEGTMMLREGAPVNPSKLESAGTNKRENADR